MSILVSGGAGYIGSHTCVELLEAGYDIVVVDNLCNASEEAVRRVEQITGKTVPFVKADLCDPAATEALFAQYPDIDAVMHFAAHSQVGESMENPTIYYDNNVVGSYSLLEAVRRAGVKYFVFSSTAAVYGEPEQTPITEDMPYHPTNVYGQTKLEGELAVANTLEKYFVVRIAWVFGLNGKNFIKTMINVGKTHDEVRVVNDQIGTPTYCFDLARLLVDMCETEKYGYYHATNEGGYISWYDFCCEFYRQYGLKTRVVPVTTEEYGLSKAARPVNSRLDKSKLIENGFEPLPTWQDAVRRYLEEAKL